MPDEEKSGGEEKSEAKMEAQAEAAENWLADFFMFKMFITRPFIKIIYVLGALAITLMALATMFGITGVFSTYALITGIVTLILGNIGWRITCEIWIIFFRLHDIAKSIDKSLKDE